MRRVHCLKEMQLASRPGGPNAQTVALPVASALLLDDRFEDRRRLIGDHFAAEVVILSRSHVRVTKLIRHCPHRQAGAFEEGGRRLAERVAGHPFVAGVRQHRTEIGLRIRGSRSPPSGAVNTTPIRSVSPPLRASAASDRPRRQHEHCLVAKR